MRTIHLMRNESNFVHLQYYNEFMNHDTSDNIQSLKSVVQGAPFLINGLKMRFHQTATRVHKREERNIMQGFYTLVDDCCSLDRLLVQDHHIPLRGALGTNNCNAVIASGNNE